jgi:NAD(P)-dependent dehydrogenase (short-subunit alcohol dehydrogenase family)
MTLAVTGYGSTIVKALMTLLPEGEDVDRIDGDQPLYDRYFLCAGVLRPKMILDQTPSEIADTINVNFTCPVQFCEQMLAHNDRARIVVMGSESGFAWSHDGAYAASKAALHRYVETKRLRPRQQLVAVAPSIIADTGMTTAREDTDNLERRRLEHPKGRFLTAMEVARLVHFLLYVDEGYLSGQVIRMNGGA